MKKFILIISLIFFYNVEICNTYFYDWREYDIHVPENIEYQEYCYVTELCEVSKYNKRLIKLNILLIKFWLPPLY